MTVTSIEQALEDSRALVALAKYAGISVDDARRFLAALADVPIRQAIRMTQTARRDEERQRSRMQRRNSR